MFNSKPNVTQQDSQLVFVENQRADAVAALKAAKTDPAKLDDAQTHLARILDNVDDLPRSEGIKFAKWGIRHSTALPEIQRKFRDALAEIRAYQKPPMRRLQRVENDDTDQEQPPAPHNLLRKAIILGGVTVLAGALIHHDKAVEKAQIAFELDQAALLRSVSIDDMRACLSKYKADGHQPHHSRADSDEVAVNRTSCFATDYTAAGATYTFFAETPQERGLAVVGFAAHARPADNAAAVIILEPNKAMQFRREIYLDKKGDTIGGQDVTRYDKNVLTETEMAPIKPLARDVAAFMRDVQSKP